MRSFLYGITRYFFLLLPALPMLVCKAPAQAVPPIGEFQGGRTYILAFPDTTQNLTDPRFPLSFDDRFRIMVYSSSGNNRVGFGRSGGELIYRPMKEGSFEIIDVREAAVITNSGAVNPGTFTLKADEPVVVYCYFASKFGAEAWTPLPVEAWGKEYRIAARTPETVMDVTVPSSEIQYREKPAPAEALILAAYDNTPVMITDASGAVTVYAMLQAGSAYQIQTGKGPGTIADLAGALIVAGKPIGVVSGNTRAQVVRREGSNGFSANSFKNSLLEWLTPTDQHGTRFVFMPTVDGQWPTGDPNEELEDKRKAEHARIYGTTGATEISPSNATSETPPVTVTSGEFYEDTITTLTARYYVTDKPAQGMMSSSAVSRFHPGVVQGGTVFVPTYTVQAAPYMVEMVPREQWTDFAPFMSPSHPSNMNHYVNVVTDTASRNRIVYVRRSAEAGVEQPFTFNRGTIPGTDLVWGTMQLLPNATYYLRGLDSSARFHGFVYGTASGYETAGPKGGLNIYEEYLALSYGYPLAPNRYVLSQGNASIGIDTTWYCSDLTIAARSDGQARVGLRSISLEGTPTNARLIPVNPAAGLIPGDLTATVRVVRTDPYMDAEGVVKIVDRAGRISRIPYSFSAEQMQFTPEKVLDFGELTMNRPDPRTVTFCNTTDRPITITGIGLGTAPSNFTVNGPALPLILAPGECAQVEIGMQIPTLDNRLYEDSLIVTTSCIPFRIGLRAETVKPCLYVGDLDFGLFDLSDPTSSQGKTVSLRICNNGRGTVTFSDSGSGVVSWLLENFTVEEQDIDELKSASLGPNRCVTIRVRFVPTGIGTFSTVARLSASTRECRDTSVWTAKVIQSPTTAVPATGTARYGISAVVPNPFRSTADIEFSLGNRGSVDVEIFDEAGERVATILDDVLEAGPHRARWNAEGRPPGVYYCRVTSGGWSGSTTLTLIR